MALEKPTPSNRKRSCPAQLVADSLEDQHVRVHRHADAENHAGDPGQVSVALKTASPANRITRLRMSAITALRPDSQVKSMKLATNTSPAIMAISPCLMDSAE